MPPAGEIFRTDAAGRLVLVLPAEFANAAVRVERVGPDELVLRRAEAAYDPNWPTIEPMVLSAADWERFWDVVDNPPPPTEALRKLMAGEPDPDCPDPH
jgi:hypothetical protein